MRSSPSTRPFTVVTVPLAILGSALMLAAAGCGGSSSDTKANEAYANSVCTAIGGWEKQVKSIATDLSGGVSKATLQAKLTQVETATTQLVTQIKAVPPPDTSEGKAAKQQLDQLSNDIQTAIDAGKSALAGLSSSPSVGEIAAAVAALAPQVQSLASETKSAVNTLKDAGGSLADAFKNTESCQNLGV